MLYITYIGAKVAKRQFIKCKNAIFLKLCTKNPGYGDYLEMKRVKQSDFDKVSKSVTLASRSSKLSFEQLFPRNYTPLSKNYRVLSEAKKKLSEFNKPKLPRLVRMEGRDRMTPILESESRFHKAVEELLPDIREYTRLNRVKIGIVKKSLDHIMMPVRRKPSFKPRQKLKELPREQKVNTMIQELKADISRLKRLNRRGPVSRMGLDVCPED